MSLSPDLIIGQLLSMAPPTGELAYVLSDLEVLLGESDVECSEKRRKQMKEIFEKYYVSIKFDENTNFRVSKFNQLEVDEDEGGAKLSGTGYYSSSSGEIFCVHFGKDFYIEKLSLDDGSGEISTSPGLISNFKNTPGSSIFTVFETDKPNTILLVNGLTEHTETNFWSIHSHCVWTLSQSDSSFTLSGEINASVHYFESCNFRLNIPKWKIQKISSLTSLPEVIELIEKKIHKFKNKIHNKLFLPDPETEGEATPGAMMDLGAPAQVTVLKKLRRQLPVTRTKFDWNLARVQFQQQVA